MLAARLERRGWSAQTRLPSDAAFWQLLDPVRLGPAATSAEHLLEHFRTRTAPHFFAAFVDHAATLAELRRRWPQTARLVERARHISEGRFELLGLRDLHFGAPVDWHLDPTTGTRAPLVHWSRIDYLNAAVAGDKKIIWELNRHQYFMTLGRAYWQTGDELYAHTFVAHLSAWMEQNQPKRGINWASSLEIAFRSISWLWALYFFKDAPQLTPQLFLRALKFLYLQARHLETYLSTYFGPNTHLTGEALGLFYLGTLLPEFRAAVRWQRTGQRILLAELERHIKPDGVYFEQSSYYHRYTTDFYTHFHVLSQCNGLHLGPQLPDKLSALLDHLMYITRPDGTVPLFGDDDGGRLVMLDERAADDFRAALATGATLFARADYKYVAGEAAEETLWLLGAAGLRAFDAIAAKPPPTSRAFSDGGYYVMRDGWTRQSDYLLIDCGPHGVLGGAHAHADALAFELAAGGRTMLVDPGTYTYTGSAALRDYFRSSAAHNTLTVDGASSSVTSGPFRWQHMAQAAPHAWLTHERFDYFAGAHDGYTRLPDPVMHAREVLFVKGAYWIICDRLAAAGPHQYDSYFHFAPGVTPAIAGAHSVTARDESGAPALQLFAFGGNGRWRIEEGWVSRCYGARTAAPVAAFSTANTGAQTFTTFLLPRGPGRQSPADVHEVEAGGGQAFVVQSAGGRDMVMLGDGQFVETPLLSADFKWTWARFAPGATAPQELVLIDGRRLCLAGQELFSAAERVAYLVIRFTAQTLSVETNARGEFNITPVGLSRVVLNGTAYGAPTVPPLRFVAGRLRPATGAAKVVR